ncbi:MAG: helix-turn-helix transcriptional regulator [Planctomycetes bacterium]|nr:helix-turn-helix transcriptional regulator [Planctomycetota bacterium]
MAKSKITSMSAVLKKAIAESDLTYLMLERETGVSRASIMRFMRGERTLRLDMADKLAEHFGIEPKRKGR